MPQYKNLPHVNSVKKSDEFISAIDHFIRWCAPYWKVGLIVLFFLVLIGLGFLVFKSKKEATYYNVNKAIFEASAKPLNEREEALRKVIKSHSSEAPSAYAAFDLAQLFMDQGKTGEAIQVLDDVDATIPSSLLPLIKVAKAQLNWHRGKLEEGLKILEGMSDAERDSTGPLVSYIKGQILEALGKKEEALKVYQELALQSEESPFVLKMAQARQVFLKFGSNESN